MTTFLLLSPTMAEATMAIFPLLLSCFLLLSIGTQVQCLHHKKMLSLQRSVWAELKHVGRCQPQKSRREKGAIVMEMKHKDYCSGQVKNWDKTLQNHLVADDKRVQHLQLQMQNAIYRSTEVMSNTQIPLTSGVKLETLNYVVTVELGGRNMTVIVDTGSDLTWVQCQPCVSCYSQQGPLFNPSESHSYRSIMCNSSTCQSLQFATGNSGICGTNPPTCKYTVRYGDGSYTRGELALEHLSLGSTIMDDFVFGCGKYNKGLFGGAAGLIGFGRSELSIVSQTSSMFGGVFSYCLPSTDADASGSLILGSELSVFRNTTPITYTNTVPNPQLSNFFLLNLTGMSIGGIAIQASGFSQISGTLIDSGTVITRLVPSVYRGLKAEFLKQFSMYPSAPSYSILDTCFDLSGYEEVEIPTMKFWFEDSVEMVVDVTGMLYFVKTDASQVCLALASLTYEDEIPIIGNYQQRNQRVVYDMKESKVGFSQEMCGYT